MTFPRIVRALPFAYLAVQLAACTSGSEIKGIARPASADAAKAHSDAMRVSKTNVTNQNIIETRNLVGEKFRVKDSELLRGTLTCVDANLSVAADAIQANGAAASPGKLRFILPNTVAAGKNIIDEKKSDLFDPYAEGRDTAAAPEATVNYLTAATLVAEVVAHNADVSSPSSKAFCGSPEAARALMKRCLPNLTASELDLKIGDGQTVAEKMATACATGNNQSEKDLNSRVALASFLSSWLFLKSER